MEDIKSCKLCISEKVCIGYRQLTDIMELHFDQRTFHTTTGLWPEVPRFYIAAANCCVNYKNEDEWKKK